MNAIDIVRQMVADGQISQEVAEKYFPELKEREDEKMMRKFLALIEWSKSYAASGITSDEAKEMTAWLEKQGKNGINGNEREIPNSAWSGEDERIIDNLVSQLGNLCARKLIKEETKDKYVNWLKSLKDKSTWKPSDEQMEALDFAIDCVVPDEFNYKKQALKDLLEQLKKLREG